MDWITLKSPEIVAQVASEAILNAANSAISSKGEFHIVLAGGSTPEHCYELLSEKKSDWANWHIWFGDERCLPRGDPLRNDTMVDKVFTSKVPILQSHIHSIAAEGDSVIAAQNYARAFSKYLPFDFVLLGMGEDGHTASLFPGNDYPDEALVVAVSNAPKPPSERISLNYTALGNSKKVIFLVTGEGKRDALMRWKNNVPLPVNRVKNADEMTLITDQVLSDSM